MFCINLCVYFGAFGGVGARMRQKQVPPMDDAMYMYGIYRELPRHTRALLFCFFIFSLFFFAGLMIRFSLCLTLKLLLKEKQLSTGYQRNNGALLGCSSLVFFSLISQCTLNL